MIKGSPLEINGIPLEIKGFPLETHRVSRRNQRMIKGVEVVSHHPFKGGNGHPHLRWRCQFPISSEVEVAIPISSEEGEDGHLISYKGGGSGHPPSLQR